MVGPDVLKVCSSFHMCLMGLRSGDRAGQSICVILSMYRYLCTIWAVWGRALSFINHPLHQHTISPGYPGSHLDTAGSQCTLVKDHEILASIPADPAPDHNGAAIAIMFSNVCRMESLAWSPPHPYTPIGVIMNSPVKSTCRQSIRRQPT